MIDIHTHILPVIDDGAESLDEALEMLETAKAHGTEEIVLTAHYPNKRLGLKLSADELIAAEQSFIENPNVKQIGIRLHTGAELKATPEILDIWIDKPITLSNTSYVLVEFRPTEHFSFLKLTAEHLIDRGYTPIIAHVERYQCLWGDTSRVKTLYNMGCVIQINPETVLHTPSTFSSDFTRFLLEHGLVDVVASDAHDPFGRNADLSEVHSVLSVFYTISYADRLLSENPQQILKNKKVLRGETQ